MLTVCGFIDSENWRAAPKLMDHPSYRNAPMKGSKTIPWAEAERPFNHYDNEEGEMTQLTIDVRKKIKKYELKRRFRMLMELKDV